MLFISRCFPRTQAGSAAARHSCSDWDGMGAEFRGNDQAHSGLGTWRYFLSLTERNSVCFIGRHLLQTSTLLFVSMTASATPSPDHLRFQNFFWLLHGNVSIVSCSFSHTVPSDWGKYSQVAQTAGSGEKLYQLDSCLEQFNLCLSLDGSLLQDSLHYNNTY